MVRTELVLLLVCAFARFSWGQDGGGERCQNKASCSECIREFGCVWCSEKNVTVRCMSDRDHQSTWCPVEMITDPIRDFLILKDKPLQDGIIVESVQIKPQQVKLALRKGDSYDLNFQYAQASDYPIDLYYILDLSASMKKHKNQLAALGGKLVNVMKNITSNFRLGFGSFVDKFDMPFVNMYPTKIDNPCGDEKCVRAYSFKNHLPLTNDYEQFSQEVEKAELSGNLDSPEGGFDALMQAIVCKGEIGWRSQARHLIVFSTDALYHTAGDGRLAGIVQPNDARCHVKNRSYIGDLTYDYPSISQLNYVTRENNINIIFIIPKADARIYHSYEQLQSAIENSGVGELAQDSNNVVDLILDIYKKIAHSIRITDNAPPSVEIKYRSSCDNPIENGCSGLTVGKKVNFTATIKPLGCLKNQTISIKPEGINEELVVQLDVLCDCPCESPDHPDYQPGSQTCNGNGDLKCGICSCKDGNYGNNCECTKDTSAAAAAVADETQCKKDPTKSDICSGRGECKCGKCECRKKESSSNELIYGKYCECDNYSCKRTGGLVCSGSERGKCDCGVCKCLAGWTGESCECPSSNSTCVSPNGDGAICSGHGVCECGICQCHGIGEGRYYGTYCEECLSCTGQRCAELLPCVECQAYQSGDYDEETCRQNCTYFSLELVDKIYEDESKQVKTCRMLDRSGCTVIFQYSSSSGAALRVKALKEKVCPEPVDVLAVVLYVIGSIVLAGLIALIVWKLSMTIHDRREYARFVNEKSLTKFQTGENPLYKKATSTFTNPVYKS